MSNLTVLPKLLKLRSINQLILSNIRQLSNNCSSFHGDQSVSTKNSRNQIRISLFEKCFHESQLITTQHCRTLYTNRELWHSSTSDTTKNTTDIDQFRANEEKIEREYEEQERQKEQNEQNGNEHTRSESTDEHDRVQKVRDDILDASLKYVTQHGWSPEAISHGAESINYPGVIHGMFPNGGIELINFFYRKCNRKLIEQLQNEQNSSSSTVDENDKAKEQLSPRDFAIRAIRLRLEMIIPFKDSWPQAVAMMTLPQNAPTSLAQLLTLVDDICYCAGDRSVDIGWYTRRIGIASIYKIVELYLLQDKSPDHKQTWEFLERRMDEGIQIQEFFLNSDQKTKTMAQALGSAFQTARNILGINCDKR